MKENINDSFTLFSWLPFSCIKLRPSKYQQISPILMNELINSNMNNTRNTNKINIQSELNSFKNDNYEKDKNLKYRIRDRLKKIQFVTSLNKKRGNQISQLPIIKSNINYKIENKLANWMENSSTINKTRRNTFSFYSSKVNSAVKLKNYVQEKRSNENSISNKKINFDLSFDLSNSNNMRRNSKMETFMNSKFISILKRTRCM